MVLLIATLLPLLHLVAAVPANDKVVKCLSASKVPQLYPGSGTFTQSIIPLNLRLNFTPTALAVPLTVPQVQAAVRCAAKYGVKVNPRSGGHSYASHSIGGEDGHLVVDLKYFNGIKLDQRTNLATVGPGVRLGNLAVKLYNVGGRAIAHGVCPGVGVGGHVLHGGQGYASHSHGLAVDFIESATIVLADSSVVTASRTSNPELFWGLRGAGYNFGIVTSFTFRTFAAPVQNINFYYPFIWTQTQAVPGWTAFQEFAAGKTVPQIERDMNIRVVIFSWAPGAILFLIEGVYHGTQEAFQANIKPLLDSLKVAGGLQDPYIVEKSLGWLDSLLYANNNDLLPLGNGSGEKLETGLNYTAHATFFTKSLMTDDLSPLGVTTFVNLLFTIGQANTRPWYFIVAAQGGPTSAVPTFNNTSYAHRDQIFEWQLADNVASGPYPPEGFAWVDSFVKGIEAAETGKTLGMYYNYADPTLGKAEADERYWLGSLERLRKLKKKVDPKGVFGNPQTLGSQ